MLTDLHVHLRPDGGWDTSTWVHGLPGHPDNISLGTDGLIWVTIASPPDPFLAVLHRSPYAVRGLVRRLPERLKPEPRRTARVLALDEEAPRSAVTVVSTCYAINLLTPFFQAMTKGLWLVSYPLPVEYW